MDEETAFETVRIIPARVGNGPAGDPMGGVTADHPRSRGERAGSPHTPYISTGSSPLAWGTGGHRRWGSRGTRIIPARVGNGTEREAASRRSSDHPRSRGERAGVPVIFRERAGSSPLAWGTVRVRLLSRVGGRIIPARVGNGGAYDKRVRWEDGSSPLAWGTARNRHPQSPVQRIIPARVGNGPWITPDGRGPTDHPRSRGERQARALAPPLRGGSSPLAWGTVEPPMHHEAGRRIIPARVGNGSGPSMRARCRSDHPRSRGERSSRSTCAASYSGSSPLAWGTGSSGSQSRLPGVESHGIS